MSPQVALLALRLGLALALYAFLALVLLYLWRDVRAAAGEAGAVPLAHLQLISPEGPGRAFALTSVNLLGRAADNTIVLDETTVSAHHARLSFQQGQWWLEDQGSKNGTGVNELEVQEPLVVTFGDRIRIGSVQLILQGGPAPSVEPTQEREPTLEELAKYG
jgi:hypothetical protein